MCGFVIYDTTIIMEKCRMHDKDFIMHSVDLFIDLVSIFKRLIIILTEKVSLFMICYINYHEHEHTNKLISLKFILQEKNVTFKLIEEMNENERKKNFPKRGRL